MKTFLTALLIALPTTLLAETNITRAPYLQQATENTITIVCRTDSPIKPSIRFGLSPDTLEFTHKDSTVIHRTKTEATNGAKPLFSSKDKRSAPANTHQYEITLTNLKTYTTYYYALFDGTKRITPESSSYRFTTHPKVGEEKEALVWIVGDSGTGGKAQRAVHQATRNYLTKNKTQLDLYLHVGDMAYGSGTDPEFSQRFFDIYEPTLRNTVCWPALGNHEGHTSSGSSGIGPYFDAYVTPTKAEAGGTPSGTEAYYSFDYGKIHFICLNSHDLDRSSNGAMAKWLKADLDKTKAEWLIAFWHHPPYTKGSHDSDRETQLIEMRELILPILESGGVDCVFTGHSHIYERSMLVDKAYATPTVADGVILDDGDGNPSGDGPYRKSQGLNPNNGSVQIVAGHGGKLGGRTGVPPIMKTSILEYGSCLMNIKKDTLTCIMLNDSGEIRDTFAIVKKGTVKHSPIARPWQHKDVVTPSPIDKVGAPMPANYKPIIPQNSKWHYLTGDAAPRPWTKFKFDHTKWPEAPAGFGYGDNDDKTILKNMRSQYKIVRVRKSFEIQDTAKLALAIRYDDAFIAFINGKEFARSGIEAGRGANARGFKLQEASKKFVIFDIDPTLLKKGANVIAIEGHNANISSSDFTLDPFVIQKSK